MDLTVEQVLALAPDASSASAGKKLGVERSWQRAGRNAMALWGECQGSALYQVRVDLSDMTVSCSCPSRKFPCKHGLGLLLLTVSSPASVPEGSPPQWVVDWLTKRRARAEQKATEQPTKTSATAGRNTRSKRADQRQARVAAGIDALDLWLADLMRQGLAAAGAQPATFWEQQAARLVDAQAPGLAGRIRRLAAIPNASPDWPERLLEELGRIALLTYAFRRIDTLDLDLQGDVRAAIGWSLKQEEITAQGEVVSDTWLLVGQRVEVDDRLRSQRTWLVGERSGRRAMILQFAVGAATFDDTLVPGTQVAADLVFWPSARPLRAMIQTRHAAPTRIRGSLPGAGDIATLLDDVAEGLAQQPWLDRFPCLLRDVVPVVEHGSSWHMCDSNGATLPLVGTSHWKLLALAGGHPVDLAGEWDGRVLTPLSVIAEDTFHVLGRES